METTPTSLLNFGGPTTSTATVTPAPVLPVPTATVPATTVPPAPKTPTAAPTPVPTYSFLDGSKYTSDGKQVSPPTVITAKPAAEDLANKQAALNEALTAQSTQAQNIANQQTTAAATPASTKPAATADDLNKIINGEAANPANQALQNVQAAADATYASFQSQISQIMNGTFPLTPAQQAQITATQNSFNQLKSTQELINKNFEGQIRFAGIQSGRNITAPQVDASIIHQALSAGVQQIAKIDSQASKAIADLQQGFMDKDYEMINNAYSAATQLFSMKSHTIQAMNENIRNATNDALALHKQAVDEQQQQLENQRVAVDFAVKNNISKDFFLIGNTAFDAKTGEAVDLAEYQRRTGQQVGLPEDQTDFTHIQSLPDQGVLTLRDNFPDAGILATDTMEQARAKLKDSALYRKSTYIAPSGGAGGSVQPGDDPQLYSGLSTPTATAVRAQVGAFKTEPVVQNFSTIQDGYNLVQSLPNDTKNPADDQALIYSLAKALDPGSVVREGEYATAQKYSQSLVASYGKGVTQAINGTGFLSKTARENIKKTIESKYNASKKSYDNLEGQYANSISTLTGRGDGVKFLKSYVTKTAPTDSIPAGTDGSEYGYPGYVSDGSQWVLK